MASIARMVEFIKTGKDYTIWGFQDPIGSVVGSDFSEVFYDESSKFERPSFDELRMAAHYAVYMTDTFKFKPSGCGECKMRRVCRVPKNFRENYSPSF